MLNIKELEESLDRALENETTESVLAWFKERDKQKVRQYIGNKGYLTNLIALHDKNSTSNTPTNSQKDAVIPASNNFALAA
jgi:beta-galactosidase/beta-glucuronidase